MARNGAEWRNGGMAEWLSYIPNVPDIFTVHADDCTYFDLLHCTYFEVLHLVQKKSPLLTANQNKYNIHMTLRSGNLWELFYSN